MTTETAQPPEKAGAATSAPAEKKNADRVRKSDRTKSDQNLEVTLIHGRSRHLGWTVFGLVAGTLLLIKLGSIGQFVGAVLILIAIFQGYKAALTFLHPPGTFKIGPDRILLPTGLCRGRDLEMSRDQLHHALFLRRAVPWTMTGPLLVIESGGKAYAYPRDWFASDSDQRRVQRALNRDLASQRTGPEPSQ